MTEHKGLAEALAAFQGEDGLTFPKTKTAKVKSQRTGGEYSYKYADLGDILPVVRPLLTKHGLCWSSKPGYNEAGELVLSFRLLHGSGEADGGEMPLGVDRGCKPQELGSAITYARRYALTAQLNLATEEDDDGGAAQASSRGSSKANGSPPRTTAKPAERSEEAASGPQKGAINARMGLWGVSENDSKAILQWRCGTAVLDRVTKKAASKLIDALAEEGPDPHEILAEITTAAETGDERATAIVARYFQAASNA